MNRVFFIALFALTFPCWASLEPVVVKPIAPTRLKPVDVKPIAATTCEPVKVRAIASVRTEPLCMEQLRIAGVSIDAVAVKPMAASSLLALDAASWWEVDALFERSRQANRFGGGTGLDAAIENLRMEIRRGGYTPETLEHARALMRRMKNPINQNQTNQN